MFRTQDLFPGMGQIPWKRMYLSIDSTGDSSAGGSPGGGTSQPGASTSPEEIEVKLPDGEVVKVTKEELAKGYMRQADYTRKTQELARMREEFEEAYETSGGDSSAGDRGDGGSDRLERTVSLTARGLSKLEARQELDRQERELLLKHGEEDSTLRTKEGMQDVYRFTYAHGKKTLEEGYELLKSFREKVKKETEEKTLQKLRQRTGASLESGTSGAKGQYTRPKDYKEARLRAEQRIES